MSKGDERTRTIDIYVDGIIVITWSSSGTTLNFETVTLSVTGTSIELRGVLGRLRVAEHNGGTEREYCMLCEMPCAL